MYLQNHHVVAGAGHIEVVVPGKGASPASVVAEDDYKDLALLKIGLDNLDYLPIAESQKVKVLDTIVVLGYPFLPTLGADVSASEGHVNAIREEGRIPLLQIDAAVNPGNSGGPVLNDRGEAEASPNLHERPGMASTKSSVSSFELRPAVKNTATIL